jgi:hypothetical protein
MAEDAVGSAVLGSPERIPKLSAARDVRAKQEMSARVKLVDAFREELEPGNVSTGDFGDSVA